MSVPMCDSIRGRFDDYHDGLLAPELAQTVRGHLAACDACREEYGLLVSCIGVIRGIETPSVPPRALRKIVDTLKDTDGGKTDLEPGLEPS